MKKTLFFLFLLPMYLSAQTNIDSLVNMLSPKLPIKEQLRLYDKIAEYYSQNDAKKSLFYGKQGLLLAEREKDKRMIARNCLNIGAAFLMTPSIDSSMIFLNRAVALSEAIKDRETEARAVSVIGIWFTLQGKNEEALEYNLKSLALYEAIGDKANAARVMINIGAFYSQLGQKERFLHYLNRAKSTIETMDLKYPNLQTAVYESLGGYYLRTGDYGNALENTLIALDLSRKNNLIRYEIVTTQYLAGIYSDGFNNYAQAEKYALECLKAAESIGNSKEFLVTAWNILAKIYIDEGKFKEGIDIALKIWNIDSISVPSAMNTAQSLATCYVYAGEKDKALYYFGKHDSLRLKGAEEHLLESMSNMEVKYETEKKEIRIAALEKEKTLYLGLGAAVIIALLSVIGLLFYRHRAAVQKRKIAEQQIRQLEQEKELIAARSALEAEKAEREIIARDLHDGVGAMLSVVKNNMSMMKSYSVIENTEAEHFNRALNGLDQSITELRRVAHHIMPSILIEKGLATALDDFCRSIPEVEFHFTEPYSRFDSEKELVLYRCAYELISNSLRHAGASRIDVHLNRDEETVYLSIVDNGCGFDPQTVPPGMGIKNLHTRLAAFGGRMDIYSEPGKGTEANVELDI